MATTTNGVTEYDLHDLKDLAWFTLKGHTCPECHRGLKVWSWKVFVARNNTGLEVQGYCNRNHAYYRVTLNCAI